MFIKTNVSQLTDVTVRQLGFIVPAVGLNALEMDTVTEFRKLQASTELFTLLTDDAYAVDSSTLILNDGTADVPQGAVESYLAGLTVTSRLTGDLALSYDGSGRLDQVSYTTGDQVDLTYDGITGELKTVIGGGKTKTLVYSGGALSSVTVT